MTARTEVVDRFVDAGELAARVGLLPEAWETFIARLDASGLLDELTACRWVIPPVDHRKPAEPQPKPPSQPAPPPKDPKGCDCAQCISTRRSR